MPHRGHDKGAGPGLTNLLHVMLPGSEGGLASLPPLPPSLPPIPSDHQPPPHLSFLHGAPSAYPPSPSHAGQPSSLSPPALLPPSLPPSA
jgi:hypothetical protein